MFGCFFCEQVELGCVLDHVCEVAMKQKLQSMEFNTFDHVCYLLVKAIPSFTVSATVCKLKLLLMQDTILKYLQMIGRSFEVFSFWINDFDNYDYVPVIVEYILPSELSNAAPQKFTT